MWGNLLGWCISAVMVVGTFGGLFALNHSLHQISDPTSFSTTSGVADEVTLPDGINDMLPKDAGPADAAAIYQRAITQYNTDAITFDTFAKTPRRDAQTLIQPALDLLVQASGNVPVAIFADAPDSIVTYKSNTPLTSLNTCGECLNQAGLLAKVSGKKKDARADFEAVIALGARMAQERLTYLELTDGLGMMGGAAIELASMAEDAHDTDQQQKYNTFAVSLSDFTKQKLMPVYQVISSVDPPVVERNVGDIFWIAQNSKSKMWRVEATLALGRYKFDAPTRGDNRGALDVVTKLATTEQNPAVKTAATAARDLTMDQYQLLH